MKSKTLTLISIVLLGFATLLNAQTPVVNTIDPLTTGTIKEQVDYILSKSSQYENNKVVKISWLNKLSSNVNDTISTRDSRIKALLEKANYQKILIDTLKNQIINTNEKLTEARTAQNSLSLMGIQLEKPAYQSITLTIIFALLIGVAFLIYLFKRSNQLVNESNSALLNLQNEFDAQRKRNLEREQTTARNHLSELNKLRNK